MIDTIKIYTMISRNIYDKIYNSSIIKTSYNKGTGEVFYEIVNDKLEGSFSSSLSVRVSSGAKYNFVNMYCLEIEGSVHKILKGYNALNGFYNIYNVCKILIKLVEENYEVTLPKIQHWFLQRIDIAKCFDLSNNENVACYINNLSHCNYPKRNIKHFQDESIYLSGCSTTLKIYNKLLEFKKHDYKKLYDCGFNVINYSDLIKGFIRFECEIKKKKLENLYKRKYIRIRNLSYNELENVWGEEFMKFIKMYESDLTRINEKRKVEERLKYLYPKSYSRLYSFFINICVDGIDNVKNITPKRTYYHYIKLLKEANIDFSQTYDIDFNSKYIDFNPFEFLEVL